MLLELFINVIRCLLDPSKVVHFLGSNMDAATLLESPSNLGSNSFAEAFAAKEGIDWCVQKAYNNIWLNWTQN